MTQMVNPSSAGGAGAIALLYDVAFPFVEGGGQRRMYEIARRLVRAGWTVDWYPLKTWEGPAECEHEGIVYRGLEGNKQFCNASGERNFREALSYGHAILAAKVDFSRYDVVWCGQWPYFHILALFLRLVPFRTKLLIDWWEIWGCQWLNYGAIGVGGWLIEVVLVNLGTRFGRGVVISRLGLRQMLAIGASRKRVVHIANGVDMDLFNRYEAAPDSRDLIYFGRLAKHKNVDHLLRAVALLKSAGTCVTVDIVGDGALRGQLETIVADLAIADVVTFHGQVDDPTLVSLLKRARIFVHPSTKEGGGSITLLEANACGLPIICYRHPLGIDTSLIKDDETGKLAEPVTPEALAAAIAAMLEPARAGAFAQACREKAAEYDWNMITGRYLQLLSDANGAVPAKLEQKHAASL